MSLKSISCSCDNAATEEVPTQSSIRVNIKSPFKEPLAQNLLAQLISGFSMPICKDANKTVNNKLIEAIPKEEAIISKDGSEKIQSSVVNSHPINLGCSYWKNRQRTLSEHSDDIYFLEDNDISTQTSEPIYAYYDDDEDEEDSDEEIYNNVHRPNSQRLHESIESLSNDDFSVNTSNNAENRKKVRFNLNPEIHVMYAWSYAYKSARKGHWESLARDRDRFRKRIENTSKYINPILSPEHRSFIYNSRFDKKM